MNPSLFIHMCLKKSENVMEAFNMKNLTLTLVACFCLFFAGPGFAQDLTPELKAKLEAKIKDCAVWLADAKIVDAVKAANTAPSAEAKDMTNDKWKELTLLDPIVRSFSKNAAGEFLKSKKDDVLCEAFVNAADGSKVAFLAKTTAWNHKGKEKHDLPMAGTNWFGKIEVDESTGKQQVQVGLPVKDGDKVIGTAVLGFDVSKL